MATPLTDTTIADAVANRIDYAIAYGDTVTIGHAPFGNDADNVNRVPGLIGGHAYSVLGIERDGTDIKLVLDNPHVRAPAGRERNTGRPGRRHRIRAPGGIVKVDITHLNKFEALVFDGPGAHGLYGPDPDPAHTGPQPASPPEPPPEPTGPTSEAGAMLMSDAAAAHATDEAHGDNEFTYLDYRQAPTLSTASPRSRSEPNTTPRARHRTEGRRHLFR